MCVRFPLPMTPHYKPQWRLNQKRSLWISTPIHLLYLENTWMNCPTRAWHFHGSPAVTKNTNMFHIIMALQEQTSNQPGSPDLGVWTVEEEGDQRHAATATCILKAETQRPLQATQLFNSAHQSNWLKYSHQFISTAFTARSYTLFVFQKEFNNNINSFAK